MRNRLAVLSLSYLSGMAMKNGGWWLLLLVGLSACGKGDEKGLTAAEKLQQGSWQLKSWTSRRVFQAQSTETDNYALSDSCVRDNRYTFGGDGQLRLDEGAKRCSPADPQTRSAGAWRLLNDDRQLQSGILGQPGTATIEDLTEGALQLSTDTTFYFGGMNSRLITTARFER